MKLSEIKVQLKGLNSYVLQLVEKINTLDNTPKKDDDGDEIASERGSYFRWDYDEALKLLGRYSKLRKELVKLLPDYFSDLMNPEDLGIRELEELSREFVFISEVLDGIEAQNGATSNNSFNSINNDSLDNTPFNKREQETVTHQLEEIRKQLIEIASEQNAPKEEIEKNIKMIDEKIETLAESSKKVGRKDWTLQFLSFVLSLSLSLSTSQEARTTLLNSIKVLINFIYNIYLLGS